MCVSVCSLPRPSRLSYQFLPHPCIHIYVCICVQSAKTKQAIKEEEMQIKVVERGQSIMVQDQEIQRKEKELEATVKKPAEALKFKQETLATADRSAHTIY